MFGLLYAFDVGHFVSLTLDVLALTLVTFMATAVAALALPYAKHDIYESSPIAKYSWGKLNLLAISAIIYLAYFGIILYYWATDARYGVNSAYSLVFMSVFYIIAAILYVAFKYYNKRRGVDIGLTYGEIPAE